MTSAQCRLGDARRPRPQRDVLLGEDMLDSPAWRTAHVRERSLYVELAARVDDQGLVQVSVRHIAALLQSGKTTAAETVQALITRGLIYPVSRTSFEDKLGAPSGYQLAAWPAGQPP